MNIPGGQLAERFGAKPVIVAALAISAIGTLLTPSLVHLFDTAGLIGVRFVIGLSQGGLLPAVNALLAAWVPLKERGRLGSLIFSGAPVHKHTQIIPSSVLTVI